MTVSEIYPHTRRDRPRLPSIVSRSTTPARTTTKETTDAPPLLETIDLGRIDYDAAYERQHAEQERILALRESDDPDAILGSVLLLEHDPPVITVSRRPDARRHLLATEEQLNAAGVTVRETDRGGDITYHGPGQLVAYPIVDLNRAGLRLHDYMRLLERAVIRACADFGVEGHRDVCATGVWVGGSTEAEGPACDADQNGLAGGRKICAMGVRVRKWISMHGLALNVATDLDHFKLIVPCGLPGRPVTSLQRETGGWDGKTGGARAIEEAKERLMCALEAEFRALRNPDQGLQR
jgi:lipoyl(octanoyl) transferase